MRFLTIPRGKGYWASIFLSIGLLAFLCGVILVLTNILFSALGVMLFSGGNVVWDYTNVIFPTFSILSGGRIGLGIGIVGGILASISQIRLWIIPTKNAKTVSERKGLFLLLSTAFVIYDVFSTYYFINGGQFWTGFGNFFLAGGVSIALFSVGPIIFSIWGMETMIENHKEGIPSFAVGVATLFGFFAHIIKSIQGVFNWELEDGTEEVEKYKKELPVEKQRGRGRPRDYETESEPSL